MLVVRRWQREGDGGMIRDNDYASRLMLPLWVEALEKALRKRSGREETLARAHARVRAGAALTRGEAAVFLGVSTRKLQRMEASGKITRCRGLGTVVRYAARDVLRLASAS